MSPPRAHAEVDPGAALHVLGSHATLALANAALEADGPGAAVELRALADAVRSALLPRDEPIRAGAFLLRGGFRPAAGSGGDLWTYRALAGGRLIVFVGDAAGNGPRAVVLDAIVRGALDACVDRDEDPDPARILASIETAVRKGGGTMTAFLALLDAERRTLRWAGAGQEGFVFALEGKVDGLATGEGTLGAGTGPTPTQMRPFVPGERLILITDGVLGAGAPAIEPFGAKRLRAALTELALSKTSVEEIPQSMYDFVNRHLGGPAAGDDMTVVAVGFGPVRAGA
jgi:serine phosphatase RsbU (regulator of sigma subunit)